MDDLSKYLLTAALLYALWFFGADGGTARPPAPPGCIGGDKWLPVTTDELAGDPRRPY